MVTEQRASVSQRAEHFGMCVMLHTKHAIYLQHWLLPHLKSRLHDECNDSSRPFFQRTQNLAVFSNGYFTALLLTFGIIRRFQRL